MKSLLFLICFEAIAFVAYSQKMAIGRVLDVGTRKPLKDVEVVMGDVKVKSNAAGYFEVTFDTTRIFTAALAGYETARLRVPAERFSFYLERAMTDKQKELVNEFNNFMRKRVSYPRQARELRVQGITSIYFEVNRNGKVIRTQVIDALSGGCSEEVVDALQKAPPVWYEVKKSTKFLLPVVFHLRNEDKPESILSPVAPDVIILPEIVITVVGKYGQYD